MFIIIDIKTKEMKLKSPKSSATFLSELTLIYNPCSVIIQDNILYHIIHFFYRVPVLFIRIGPNTMFLCQLSQPCEDITEL